MGLLISNGVEQHLFGLVPLVLLRFVGRNAALVAAGASYAVLLIAFSLREAGWSVAEPTAPTRGSLLYYGPTVWASYAVGFIQSRAVARELQHSKEALSDALRAVRRAALEKEARARAHGGGRRALCCDNWRRVWRASSATSCARR